MTGLPDLAYLTARGNDRPWARGPSGLFLPPNQERKDYLGVGLFAGCGGFDLGCITAGFHMVAASEWNTEAARTYLYNLGSARTVVHVGSKAGADESKRGKQIFAQWAGRSAYASEIFSEAGKNCKLERHCEHFFLCDVRELTGQQMLALLEMDRGDLHTVVGGPPCQGFSVAGPRNVHDPRNSLVFEFARVVLELHPMTFAMENVPGMLSMVTPDGLPLIDELCMVFEKGGWGLRDAVKKALLYSAGVGAAVKTKKDRPVAAEAEGEQEGQGLLF